MSSSITSPGQAIRLASNLPQTMNGSDCDLDLIWCLMPIAGAGRI